MYNNSSASLSMPLREKKIKGTSILVYKNILLKLKEQAIPAYT